MPRRLEELAYPKTFEETFGPPATPLHYKTSIDINEIEEALTIHDEVRDHQNVYLYRSLRYQTRQEELTRLNRQWSLDYESYPPQDINEDDKPTRFILPLTGIETYYPSLLDKYAVAYPKIQRKDYPFDKAERFSTIGRELHATEALLSAVNQQYVGERVALVFPTHKLELIEPYACATNRLFLPSRANYFRPESPKRVYRTFIEARKRFYKAIDRHEDIWALAFEDYKIPDEKAIYELRRSTEMETINNKLALLWTKQTYMAGSQNWAVRRDLLSQREVGIKLITPLGLIPKLRIDGITFDPENPEGGVEINEFKTGSDIPKSPLDEEIRSIQLELQTLAVEKYIQDFILGDEAIDRKAAYAICFINSPAQLLAKSPVPIYLNLRYFNQKTGQMKIYRYTSTLEARGDLVRRLLCMGNAAQIDRLDMRERMKEAQAIAL